MKIQTYEFLKESDFSFQCDKEISFDKCVVVVNDKQLSLSCLSRGSYCYYFDDPVRERVSIIQKINLFFEPDDWKKILRFSFNHQDDYENYNSLNLSEMELSRDRLGLNMIIKLLNNDVVVAEIDLTHVIPIWFREDGVVEFINRGKTFITYT